MDGIFMETMTERSVGYLTRHGPDLSLNDMVSIWWVIGDNDDYPELVFVYRGVAHGIPDYIRSQKVIKIVNVDDIPLHFGIHVPKTDHCIFIKPTNPDMFKQHIERWNDMSDMGGLVC